MSNKTQQLEHEIAEMEERLANVKVTVDVEREAWRKSYRTGKKGTKWKSAAREQPAASSKTPVGNSSSERKGDARRNLEVDVNIMPSFWDALELAQFLQTKQLTAFAQVVICEQITGQALLDTAPAKMRQVFQDIIASNSDPNWKLFLQECAKLHKLEKKLEKSSNMVSAQSDANAKNSSQDPLTPGSPRATTSLFPQISPRIPNLTTLSTSSTAPDAEKDANRRRMKTVMPTRKLPVNTQQLATCWNCGTRFSRSQGSIRGSQQSASKALTTRIFCSKECQTAMENTDISISTSVSASLQVSTARELKDPTAHHQGMLPNKARSFNVLKAKLQQANKCGSNGMITDFKQSLEGFDFLHITQKGSVSEEAPRPPLLSSSTGKQNGPAMIRKRIVIPSSSFPSVASISSTRTILPGNIPPLMLTTTNDPSRQSKVYQKSVYKLDPDLYQAKGATFASCFYNGAAASGTSNTRKNLMRLQKYISVKSLHRLSLTSRSWFDAIHQSSLADPLWGFHLLRLWKRSEDDELFLHEIGVLKKPERPRTMLMKLTRQVGRVVLENIKVLLTPENWHLATAMSFAPTLTLQAVLRISKHDILNHGQHSDQQPSLPKADARADMFEQIAIIYNKKGEIVAVRAQELIRPIAEDQMLTDILHGMRSGVLATVECRRLRLFSVSNRLSFDQWHVLSANSRVVFDFFWGAASSTTSITATDASTAGTLLPRVWHQKILERMQKNMQHRLLGKESIQQVLKAVNDCNGPPQALVALEKFLTLCHTTMDSSTAASSAQTAKKRKEQQLQQHSPTPKTHAYST